MQFSAIVLALAVAVGASAQVRPPSFLSCIATATATIPKPDLLAFLVFSLLALFLLCF
jgi:hypothetical protein